MPAVEALSTFIVSALIFKLSPGPSTIYIMSRTIGQGVNGGIVAAFGLAFGLAVHVIACAFGLSAIFKYSPTGYIIVKIFGALYLIYIGIVYWNDNDKKQSKNNVLKSKSNFKIFKESVLVEVTNPNVALFFFAFLPHFISPTAGSIATQIILLGTIVTILAVPCDIMVAVFYCKIMALLTRNKKLFHLQERVLGSILVGMGGFVIVNEVLNIK